MNQVVDGRVYECLRDNGVVTFRRGELMRSSSTEIGEGLERVRRPGKHGVRSGGPREIRLESAARTESVVVGSSTPMRRLREQVHQAARVNSKVLLQGETGTGKGLVAREIHRRSRRRCEAFVHVDCAALSPSLIESELFGHEKGSFTGATTARKGRFELGDRGTVFLDEIGDLDRALQSKLLRALEDCTYERVGGTQSLAMTARVIADAADKRVTWGVHPARYRCIRRTSDGICVARKRPGADESVRAASGPAGMGCSRCD
jgi:transcriptional regulator with GAF, ATPase, and Fis domain